MEPISRNRQCTDFICLIIFITFLVFVGLLASLVIIEGNPYAVVQTIDSSGHVCSPDRLQFYFDLSKCFTTFWSCPSRTICVDQCPNEVYEYVALQQLESSNNLSKLLIRSKLICIENIQPINDSRTIVELVEQGYCAARVEPSKPVFGRCVPSHVTEGSFLSIDTIYDFIRLICEDIIEIKYIFLSFILLGFVLATLYVMAVRFLTGTMVFFTIFTYLAGLAIFSAICWCFALSDFRSNIFIQRADECVHLRIIYTILAIVASLAFLISSIVICQIFERIQLSIIVFEQAAKSVFSVLSSLFWSPLIFVLFVLLTTLIVFIQMCLSTTGRPLFRTTINNQSVPCRANQTSVNCTFQQTFGYDSLILEDIDPITGALIQFLVDYRLMLSWIFLFAYFWSSASLFAFEKVVLAGVFSEFYWTKEQLSSSFPLWKYFSIVVRYHLGSIIFGSLLIATLHYIRSILDYFQKKLRLIGLNIFLRIFSCVIWIFENFLKFLNTNSYVLIVSRGFSFCKATRRSFMILFSNPIRFFVIFSLSNWILFFGTTIICSLNVFLFVVYLYWSGADERISMCWTSATLLLFVTFYLSKLVFSVYEMAIRSIFVCFLEDLYENDGTEERPYAMNNELLNLVQKTRETHTAKTVNEQ